MKMFSIAQLEQYSLIKAHTFRTWEQRYDLLEPQRSDTNIRFYSIEDLSFLLEVALLNRLGHKISSLDKLDRETIHQKVQNLIDATARQEHLINQLIVCAFDYRIEDFEFLLDNAVSVWGIEQTIEEIILPFLERLKFFSYKGCTSSEYHFVATALRKKIILGIEQARTAPTFAPPVLLFLPEREHFDLMLLYIAFQLKKAGIVVLYLGTNVSAADVGAVISAKKPSMMVTYIAAPEDKRVNQLSRYIQDLPPTTYIICTPEASCEENSTFLDEVYASHRDIADVVLSKIELEQRTRNADLHLSADHI